MKTIQKLLSHMELKRIVSMITAVMILASFLGINPQKAYAMNYVTQSVDSYEAYLALIEQNDIPWGFVEYDDIRVLGEFKSYRFYGNFGGEDIVGDPSIFETKAYMEQFFIRYVDAEYLLVDENDMEISLSIHDAEKMYKCWYPDNGNLLDMQQYEMTDMRYLGKGETGYIQRGSLAYVYNKGQLNAIIFQLGVTCFHIRADFYHYSLNGENTIISQLLSINGFVAENAYHRLVSKIPAQVGYYKPIFLPCVVVTCMTAAISVVICIVVKRSRRNNNIRNSNRYEKQ